MASTPIPASVLEQHPHWVLAIKRGLLNKQQIDEALAVHQSVAKLGVKKTLDEILVQKKYITPEQLRQLMEEMKPA
ncbi:MAG: hypothetical protein HY291_18985 [Planctomycetes bacterium]|nr:hypothetical protein [Planctomycetota bacterium]